MLPIFPRNGRPANRVILVRKHSLCVGRPPYKMDNTRFCRFCQWNWKKIGALCNFQKPNLVDLCNILHSMEKPKTTFLRACFPQFFYRKQNLDSGRFRWFHPLLFALAEGVFLQKSELSRRTFKRLGCPFGRRPPIPKYHIFQPVGKNSFGKAGRVSWIFSLAAV